MKKCTGIVLSLLVLILLAYYIMGFILESTLNKNIEALPKTFVVNAHLENYQRGWFSSQAVLAIKVHIPKEVIKDKNGASKVDQAVDFTLSYPLTINHGPVIFTANGIRFGIGHATTLPETHYNVIVSYFNNTLLKYAFPSFAIKSTAGPNGESFDFELSGITSTLSVSPNLDNFDGNFTLYGLSGSANKAEFKLGKVLNTFKFNRTQEGLWLGHTHFSLPVASVTAANQKTFDLQEFKLDLGSDLTDGVVNFNFDLSLQKLFVNSKNYGPGTLKLSIKNLDPTVLAHLNQLERNMLQNNQNPNLQMLALFSEFPKLLSKGAALELSQLSFMLPEGKIEGNFKLALPNEDYHDPGQLVQKAYGEGQFKAPMTVVRELMVASIENDLVKEANKNNQIQINSREPVTTTVATGTTGTTGSATPAPINYNAEAQTKADKILQNLVSKGLIKVEGSDYVINFKLENQQFIVNGQPFKPDMLK